MMPPSMILADFHSVNKSELIQTNHAEIHYRHPFCQKWNKMNSNHTMFVVIFIIRSEKTSFACLTSHRKEHQRKRRCHRFYRSCHILRDRTETITTNNNHGSNGEKEEDLDKKIPNFIKLSFPLTRILSKNLFWVYNWHHVIFWRMNFVSQVTTQPLCPGTCINCMCFRLQKL